jgi:hypothetical protein
MPRRTRIAVPNPPSRAVRSFRFYDKGEFLTAKEFALELRDKINECASASPIHKILHSIGLKYRKTDDRHIFFLGREDIVADRIEFLRTVHNIRISGDERPVLYLDETWDNQSHSKIH